MLYLNERNILDAGIDWIETINAIEKSVDIIERNDFSQPIKPYLRFKDLKNRIIAMPGYIGGDIDMAGIKWIASFPSNILKGKNRANSIIILNNTETGEPIAVCNTPLLSIIRTTSVSGLILKKYLNSSKKDNLTLGIIGFGPIGQYHLRMCNKILGSKLNQISIFDTRKIEHQLLKNKNVKIVNCWEDAYKESDIVITCTVSNGSYIDFAPKPGSLHLNVSLRDYKINTFEFFKNSIIVDNWEEVCRENTDIENMHKNCGLIKGMTKSIIDVVKNNCIEKYPQELPIMFNPMGMAVFDISIATYYYNICQKKGIGTLLVEN